MPQDQSAPEETPKKEGGIDPSQFLLPKKDPVPGKTLESASRANAGALLEQEQNASLPKQRAPALQPLTQKKDDASDVPALETYRGDIEKLVQQKNVSVVSIAAAEEMRRSAQQSNAPAAPQGPNRFVQFTERLGMAAVAIVLLLLAAAALVLIYQRTRPLAIVQTAAPSPFISVDKTEAVIFDKGPFTRPALMSKLNDERQSLPLSAGLVDRLLLAQATTTQAGDTYVPIAVQQLVLTLAPDAPQELTRALTPEYLLGVHSFAGNQGFLILGVDSYSQAFSGMLTWEPRLESDLSPFFVQTSPVVTPQQAANFSSTTPAELVNTGFVDAVVENYDTRVVRDQNGSILLLWTFLDAHTILIADSEHTLHEILLRRALSQDTGQ